MTDLHSHLVYDFDDGADNREECCRMLELYAAGGVKKVCCSSHSSAQAARGDYRERFAETSELAESFGITLVPALEYSLADLLADPQIPLGSGRYFLLDTGNFIIDSAFINKLMPLNVRGNFFCFAHPERLHPGKIARNAEKYALLRGSCCQVNAASLSGLYGAAVKKAAWQMVESGFCSVIASDAHNEEGIRAFFKVEKMLRDIYPAETVRKWFSDNPELLISGQSPEHIPVVPLSLGERLKRRFSGR